MVAISTKGYRKIGESPEESYQNDQAIEKLLFWGKIKMPEFSYFEI